jgi:hypothetical protein
LGIRDDDSFLDRIENCLEKTFFLREPQKIILHFLWPDFAEAADQFVNKTGFHCSIVMSSGVETSLNISELSDGQTTVRDSSTSLGMTNQETAG